MQQKRCPTPQRRHRAQLNLVEQLAPFAVLVLVGHALHISPPLTQWSVIAFFWLRVIHAAGMVTGMARSPVRQIIFTASWLATIVLAWQVLVTAR